MSGRLGVSESGRGDRGAILPLVLVVAIVFSMVIVALARMVTTDLRAAAVAEGRAERQAAAEGAIEYGVERLRLGQTLCNSPSGGFGTVTPTLLDRNGTATTVQCARTGSGSNDITGWSVIVTGQGITADLLKVQGGSTKRITGSMYVRDVTDITFVGGGTGLEHRDGDLWHMRATCPGAAVTLPGTYTFNPTDGRGPICTTAAWTQLVEAPTIPNLNTLPVNTGATYTPVGTCRVFSPGRYTGAPQTEATGTDPDLYFRSGVYWFDNVGEIDIEGQAAWFGHNRTTTPAINNPDCEAARLADPNTGGSGAVAFLGGTSRFSIGASGSIEFFDRTVGQYQASIVAIPSGAGYTASNVVASASGSSGAILSVASGSTNDAVVRGLLYAPAASLLFDNSSNSAKQQLLGGGVVARLSIQASASASGFIISTAATPTLSKVVLTATATSADAPTAETTVQAVVDYRPDLAPASRVAVNSLRVVAP